MASSLFVKVSKQTKIWSICFDRHVSVNNCTAGWTSRRLTVIQETVLQLISRLYRQTLPHASLTTREWDTGYQRVQPDRACKKKQSTPECDSAIGQHLLENDQCAANYNEDQFSILDTARSRFHLTLLEASYIRVRRPYLCKQKEFVHTLNLFK